MSDIKFSFIMPSIRFENCLRLYHSLMNNSKYSKYSFEVIVVGPEKISIKLPFNFIYIYSEVKVTQCIEIAARRSNGEYIIGFRNDNPFFREN